MPTNDKTGFDIKNAFEEWLNQHCTAEEAQSYYEAIVSADAFITRRKICTRSVFHMIRKNAIATLYTLKSNRDFRKLVPSISIYQRSIMRFDEFMSENETRITQSLVETMIHNVPNLDEEEEPEME